MFRADNYKQFATVREIEPARVILHVFGDVDLFSAGELGEAIDNAADIDGNSLVMVNFSRCRSCGPIGIIELLNARERLGARLVIVANLRSHVIRALRVAGVDTMFTIVTELVGGPERTSYRC